MSLRTYRKAIATLGLLDHATVSGPDGPPLTEEQRQKALRKFYIENHLRRLEEEPGLEAELKRQQKKKRGPKVKWGAVQKIALIVEIESRLPTRGRNPLLSETSITFVCKTLAREDYWKRFLEETEDVASTLRKNYSGWRDDQKLRKFARYVTSLDASRRESFVRNALAPIAEQRGDKKSVDEQTSGQELQRAMLGVVRGKG
jgi:hypothetical protein